MAQHKAAKKAIRQSDKRRLSNRYYAKTMRNAIRDLRALETKKEAEEKLPKVISFIDKVLKRNVIHRNKAANLKSKLTHFVNQL
ncbi:MAG: 30S ribosomal protein S20 [Chitinophagales bacterium]|nr:30S ribosomal protein S20 [Chitinophagales bacterium]